MIYQNNTNCFLTLPTISFGMTLRTLNLTVFDNGLFYFAKKIPALSNHHNVTFLDWSEGWRDVDWYISVSLLIPVVFGNIV